MADDRPTYPTDARLALAVRLDELPDQTTVAGADAVDIAADALNWCQRYEREMTADREALDKLARWFVDNTDEDGQWDSAADFIEYAAEVITQTGRTIEPEYVLLCDDCGEEDRTVVMVPDQARFTGAGIMRCPTCGGIVAHWDRDDMIRADMIRADDDACPDDPDGLHHVGCGCE